MIENQAASGSETEGGKMSYSGGMSQYAHDQENESGMDLCECWHEEQRRLLTQTQIGQVTDRIRRFAGTAQPDNCISTQTGAST